MKFGHQFVLKLIDAQLELRKVLGLPEKQITEKPLDASLVNKARELSGAELAEALMIGDKLERQGKVKAIRAALDAKMKELYPETVTPVLFSQIFDKIEIETVRKNVLEKNYRIGGRGFEELRPLDIQVGLFPRTHGSALFSRGETQSLSIVTLGTTGDAQGNGRPHRRSG